MSCLRLHYGKSIRITLAAGRAAWGAAMLMLQHGADAPTLLFYEVGTPQRTNLLIDITDVWSEKLQAMHCYPSQQQQQNYVRHIEALNIYRIHLASFCESC